VPANGTSRSDGKNAVSEIKSFESLMWNVSAMSMHFPKGKVSCARRPGPCASAPIQCPRRGRACQAARKGTSLAGEPLLKLFGVFLLVTQDVLDQVPGGGVLVADPLDYLAVALDHCALGNQVGFDHCLQV
jgi:hypothetical protein